MKQILYNRNTKQLSREYPNGYPIAIPDHEQSYIFLLDVVEVERPPIQQNEYLTPKEPTINLENKQYIKDWTINVRPEPTNEEIRELRQQAYLGESDPLLMAIQSYERRGKDATNLEEQWLAKIEEINLRYPYHDKD